MEEMLNSSQCWVKVELLAIKHDVCDTGTVVRRLWKLVQILVEEYVVPAV